MCNVIYLRKAGPGKVRGGGGGCRRSLERIGDAPHSLPAHPTMPPNRPKSCLPAARPPPREGGIAPLSRRSAPPTLPAQAVPYETRIDKA